METFVKKIPCASQQNTNGNILLAFVDLFLSKSAYNSWQFNTISHKFQWQLKQHYQQRCLVKNTYTAIITLRLNGIAQKMRKKMKNNDNDAVGNSRSVTIGSILRWSDTGWMVERVKQETEWTIASQTHTNKNWNQKQHKHTWNHSKSFSTFLDIYIIMLCQPASLLACLRFCLFVYNSCNSNAYDTTATGFPLPISVTIRYTIFVRHTLFQCLDLCSKINGNKNELQCTQYKFGFIWFTQLNVELINAVCYYACTEMVI